MPRRPRAIELVRRESARAADREGAKTRDERVHTTLARLVRLQHEARGVSFLPRQPVHSLLAGRHASKLRGRGFDFDEIRAYQQGDDVRLIDWKVTARTRKPHTRVYSEERERPGLLVVDQRINMFFGTRVRMKSVAAAEAAAIAAWRLVANGDRVGAVIFDDTELVEVRPGRSPVHVRRLLAEIVAKNGRLRADLDVEANAAMLERALETAARLARHDHIVVVASDFDGANDEAQRSLAATARHNDVIGLLVHDPSARSLTATDSLRVTDGQLDVELDLGREQVRQRLVDQAGGRLARVFAWEREIGVPILPLDTAAEVGAQIRSLLGERPRPQHEL